MNRGKYTSIIQYMLQDDNYEEARDNQAHKVIKKKQKKHQFNTNIPRSSYF